ncbi:hypothetical protein GCM10028862_17900 [Luteimonas pelagia]
MGEARRESLTPRGPAHQLNGDPAHRAGTHPQPGYPAPRPLPEDGHLQAERMFLDAGSATLRGDQAGDVLASEEFDEFVQVLRDQMATDRDAGDLARFYGDQISDQLPPAAALGELACGTSVCIGSVRDSIDGQGGETWVDTFFRSPDSPHSSLVYAQVPGDGRNVETRFVIGTDPAYAGLSFPFPDKGGD